MKLLVYKPDEAKLEEIAVDINLNPVFLTAIEMIDDEVFLGADGRHLFDDLPEEQVGMCCSFSALS